jgi:hypothetical protein
MGAGSATSSWPAHTPWWERRTTTASVGCALEVLKIRNGQQLDPVFRADRWRVCSALVADCYKYAGLDLEQGLPYPNLISPADLYNLIARQA